MGAAGLMDVLVPDIGDFDRVPVIEILVSAGDAVALDDPLLTLESDKATMDVPAPAAGLVKELEVAVGDKVAQGTLLMRLETADEEAAPDAAASAISAETSDGDGDGGARSAPPAPPPPPSSSATVYASPSVRRVARELGIELAQVEGSGRKGRIIKADVEAQSSQPPGTPSSLAAAGPDLAPWPSLDFARFGPVERCPRTRIEKLSAPNLARNWVRIPHVTHNDEADITDLEPLRQQLNEQHAGDGVKVTMVGFLVAACVATLKRFPKFNSSLDGDELILKRYYNIGFAADTPGGLVVPVIKGADGKGILEIARELSSLSGKAREGKLGLGDAQGGTFTISSLGGIGGTSFTPIINAPEVAILGVTRAVVKPVWSASEFRPRLMLPLSLSYDHRVIDGAAAARFVAHLAGVLGDLRRALL